MSLPAWLPDTDSKRNKRPRKSPEADLQKAVVRFLYLALPHDVEWSALDSARKRTPAQQGFFKAMGGREGVPDMVFVRPQTGTIWIELKAPKGKISPAQQRWMDAINATPGSWAYVCRSVDDVERALRKSGLTLRATVINFGRDIPPLDVGECYGG